ncbi:MAG: AMP-binding protein [Gammaproteobacteria bacterium]|nr:AMP-binding protein [Gammaproteobacteria bacterium]
MRLIEHFDRGAERFPERAFLVDEHGSLSYAAARASSHRIANALARAGHRPGAKAAVYSANAARSFECVLGIIRAGLVWVPVNVRNSIEDCAFTLDNCEVELLFYQQAFADSVAALRARCPRLRATVCVDGSGADALEGFIAGCADLSPDVPQGPDDIVTLFSSGGTSGLPKAVMMPNRSWEAMVLSCQILLHADDPVHLVAAPMTHAAGGSALAYAAMGMTNVMLPAFDPQRVMEGIARHRVTHLFLPPTAIYRLLAHPDVRRHDYSSLRYFQCPSAPMAIAKLREAVEVFGPVMVNGFGQTETGLNPTFFPAAEIAAAAASGADRRLGSVGRAGPLFRVEIMDDDGRLLPPEAPGEIVMQSYQLFAGYYRNEAETQASRAHGWHHTGDIGVKDADGYLYVVDRKKDMIISGGFNVFPAEVERIIADHPAVQDCAVIGAPHEDWGELVTAVVELKAGRSATAEEIMAFCRGRLSGVKTPKAVQFTAELPRSPVGKVLRRKVREPFWAGRERKI